MLTKNEIETNFKQYWSLLSKLENKEHDLQGFGEWVKTTDLISAPASTNYHLSCMGGLVQHCLNVYNELKKLVEIYELDVSHDDIVLCALLHDLSKVDYYETYMRNVKDELGNWIQKCEYKKSDNRKYIYYDHGSSSAILAMKWFKLSDEVIQAICCHMNGLDTHSFGNDISEIYSRNSLAVLLHLADMTATYIIEHNE